MSGFYIQRPATAFSLSGRNGAKKKPRDKAATHLAWVATLPSLVPGTGRVDPAHVRYSDPRYAKPAVGMGEKPDDKWVVPLARSEHDRQHSMNEQAYWQSVGIDPLHVALMLWAHSGDDEAGAEVIERFRKSPEEKRTE